MLRDINIRPPPNCWFSSSDPNRFSAFDTLVYEHGGVMSLKFKCTALIAAENDETRLSI